MPVRTLRGWVVAAIVGVVAATLTFLLLIQVRHWLTDEQQLHEIVGLIQAGRIHVEPAPSAPPVAPAPAAPKKE